MALTLIDKEISGKSKPFNRLLAAFDDNYKHKIFKDKNYSPVQKGLQKSFLYFFY